MNNTDDVNVLTDLHKELLDAGLPRFMDKEDRELYPLDVFVSGGESSVPYIDILLKYAPSLNKYDCIWMVRIFLRKGLQKLFHSFYLSWSYNRCTWSLWRY